MYHLPHGSRNDAPGIATLRLGTQGWNCPEWIGPFYPMGTRSADSLRPFVRAFTDRMRELGAKLGPVLIQPWAAIIPVQQGQVGISTGS